MTLRSAFFADWRSGSTVLLWGDATGMRELRDFLSSPLTALKEPAFETFCTSADGNRITIRYVSDEQDAGMRLVRGRIAWSLHQALAKDFGDKVDVLTTAVTGHQYLDARGNE